MATYTVSNKRLPAGNSEYLAYSPNRYLKFSITGTDSGTNQMKYTATCSMGFDNADSTTYLGTGYVIKAWLKINGVTSSTTELKSYSTVIKPSSISNYTGTYTFTNKPTVTVSKTSNSSFDYEMIIEETFVNNRQYYRSVKGTIGTTALTANLTVYYDANGGSSVPATQTTTSGSTVTLASAISRQSDSELSTFLLVGHGNGGTDSEVVCVKDTITSYTFTGWLSSQTGSVYSASGKSHSITRHTKFSAQWTSSQSESCSNNTISLLATPTRVSDTISGYTLTINPNFTDSLNIVYTTSKTRSYTFKGWGSTATTTTTLSNATKYTNSAVVYALWNQSDSSSTSITLPALERPGYIFKGYSTSASSTTIAYNPNATYTPTSNRTLYGVWEEDPMANCSIYIGNQKVSLYVGNIQSKSVYIKK